MHAFVVLGFVFQRLQNDLFCVKWDVNLNSITWLHMYLHACMLECSVMEVNLQMQNHCDAVTVLNAFCSTNCSWILMHASNI